MTLFEIKSLAATYLQKTAADLTVNGLDMGLLALNQARKLAELNYDFEFSRQLLTLSVDGITGGSLENSVVQGTDTHVEIKTVIDVGNFDVKGRFYPVEWTTRAEGLERQREEKRNSVFNLNRRYPTDAECTFNGTQRVILSNNRVDIYPQMVGNDLTFNLGFEVYAFWNNWTDADLTTGGLNPSTPIYDRTEDPHINGQFWNNGGVVMCSLPPFVDGEPDPGDDAGYIDIWTEQGQQYLLWQTICQLNYYFKEFVPRQEGNVAVPSDLAANGLEVLKTWDAYRYEQFRRHNR